MSHSYISSSLKQSLECLQRFLENPEQINRIQKSVELMTNTLKRDGRILACGNGGSMCDSLHFVEELTGRYRKDRTPLSALSMGEAGHLTCVGNDYGFDFIFSRMVEAHGRKGDTLLAISTSGNSTNIIKAIEAAHKKEVHVVALLGKDGGKIKSLLKPNDVGIIVDHSITDRIQEVHIKIIHIIIEGIERHLFPDHYA